MSSEGMNGNGNVELEDLEKRTRFQVNRVDATNAKNGELDKLCDDEDHVEIRSRRGTLDQDDGRAISPDGTTNYDTRYAKSFRQMTREALPRLDNYRNIMSIQAAYRPTLEELHNATLPAKQISAAALCAASPWYHQEFPPYQQAVPPCQGSPSPTPRHSRQAGYDFQRPQLDFPPFVMMDMGAAPSFQTGGFQNSPPTAPGFQRGGYQASPPAAAGYQGGFQAAPSMGDLGQIAYMVGIYMQPRSSGGITSAPFSEAVGPSPGGRSSISFINLKPEPSSDEGLSLLDDVLLQTLGDILAQYDDDGVPGPTGPGSGSDLSDAYGPPIMMPSQSRSTRLVLDEVRPALRVGEFALTQQPPATQKQPRQPQHQPQQPQPQQLLQMASRSAPQQPPPTMLVPSAPYTRRRRFYF